MYIKNYFNNGQQGQSAFKLSIGHSVLRDQIADTGIMGILPMGSFARKLYLVKVYKKLFQPMVSRDNQHFN